MPRPYKKKPWPYLRKDGLKSYRLGYYDHEGAERTKVCVSAREASDWAADYSSASVRGKESLRRFLLDLDAKEARAAGEEGRTIAEVTQQWFAVHADPVNEGGLAPSTFHSYRHIAYRYILGREGSTRKREVTPPLPYAVALANTPAAAFNAPATPRAWREAMRMAQVPAPTRDRAWKVLSSVLSWAADSALVPEVETNGCLLASERVGSKRRSTRRGGTGVAASAGSRRPRHGDIAHWALSPMAVELIRARLLQRVNYRNPILALRDATIVSLQYGLACRDQEVWGLRWRDLHEGYADIHEALSWGAIDDGKTYGSERRTYYPSLLWEDIQTWRTALRTSGVSERGVDFVFAGDLGGRTWGVREAGTDACHFSGNQASKWGPNYFAAAVKEVAEHEDGYADVNGATPYSLRRGGISLRLRAEDSQVVAAQCGTSLQMLDRHYAFAIDDLRRQGPRPADTEWREARAAAVARSRARQSAELALAGL
jgi:integrase